MQGYPRHCIFCEIIAKRSPATIHYEDDKIMVFSNILRWVPVMLLVVPKEHYTQSEFWGSALLSKAGKVAIEVGKANCPRGFRVLANFGWDAMQSQEHGHIHVVGGMHLGPYV